MNLFLIENNCATRQRRIELSKQFFTDSIVSQNLPTQVLNALKTFKNITKKIHKALDEICLLDI